MEFLTFRADGMTPISGGAVSPCETIVYQVRLTTAPGACAFEGGNIFITTPDDVRHDVTPTTGIPCVGGTTSPCDPTVTDAVSQLSFTIDQASGWVVAAASYGLPVNGVCEPNSFCGTAHDGEPDLANSLSVSLPTATSILPCPASTQCLTSICDPTLEGTGADTGRKGLCTTSNQPSCTTTTTSTTSSTTTIAASTTTSSTTTSTTVPCGDVNGDGVVDVADALVMAQFDVGLWQCAEGPFTHPEVCEVNGDGACNIGDALRVMQCNVGLVSCAFSCTPFTCQ